MLNCSACLAIQQVFSKPCLVNLILKDAPLVFSISRIYSYNLYQTTYTGIATYPFSLCFLSRLLVNNGPFFGDDGDIFDFSDSPTVDNGVPFDFLCKLVGVPTSTICIFPLLPNVFRNESINLAPSLGFEGMETPNISQLLRWRSWYKQSKRADRVRSCKRAYHI